MSEFDPTGVIAQQAATIARFRLVVGEILADHGTPELIRTNLRNLLRDSGGYPMHAAGFCESCGRRREPQDGELFKAHQAIGALSYRVRKLDQQIKDGQNLS